MVRSDKLGTTSIIRDLALSPRLYEAMNHFFRAASWKLPDIRRQWMETVCALSPLWKEGDYTILVGDGVKQAKEARRMPGVKRLFQESENSSKPAYIHGHMFGGIGVLAGTVAKAFCIPLSISLQDGVETISKWGEEKEEVPTHVVQMVQNGYEAAGVFGKSLLLLDRYFLSVPALQCLSRCNSSGKALMHIVTKAKKSCLAYEKPPQKKPGRGRPPLKGDPVKLKHLFASRSGLFTEAKATLYGKEEAVRYYAVDLLWGQKLYRELRFVLVEYRGIQSILVSTDLGLDPVAIIRLYSYRFKIESTFREFKQVTGGFCYRFWSKSMPKLNRYQKKGDIAPVDLVADPKEQKRILLAVKAIEGYVQFSCIAMGILQLLALMFSNEMQGGAFRFLRTPSKSIVSEATVANYLRTFIFRNMAKNQHLSITRFIHEKQETPDNSEDLRAA